jgi:lactate permease
MDIQGVAGTASSINLIAGPVIPLMMLLVIVTSKKERWWRSFIECVPWTLWTGFAFTVPMWLFVKVGQEFGTLLGALSGIIITGVSIKLHFLTPKNIWQIKAPVSATNDSATAPVRLFYLPYLILVILLLAAKFILKNAEWNIYLPGNIIYGAKLFNPGWLFLLTLLVLGMSQRNILKVLSTAFFESIPKAARSLKVIFIITSFVQVFISTGMLNSIAANIQPGILSFLTPFLGAFGSFLTGSATVSNMLIAPVISSIEVMNLKFLLALQLLGAAAGNMIALQNILTITAAIDSKEREGKLLLYLITLCLLYLSLILVVACLLPL